VLKEYLEKWRAEQKREFSSSLEDFLLIEVTDSGCA